MRPVAIIAFTVVDFLLIKLSRLKADSQHFYPSSFMPSFSFSTLWLVAVIILISEGKKMHHLPLLWDTDSIVTWGCLAFFQWIYKSANFWFSDTILFSCWADTTGQCLFSHFKAKLCIMLFWYDILKKSTNSWIGVLEWESKLNSDCVRTQCLF